jgi:hypothetical protein
VEQTRFIYLDTKHWIQLARARFGLRGGEAFQPALQAVERAVTERQALFPFGMVSIYETLNTPDPEQRKRLAHVMVSLSGNTVLATPEEVVPKEIANAVSQVLGRELPFPDLSPFRSGLIRAFRTEEQARRERYDLLASLALHIPIDTLFKRAERAFAEVESEVGTFQILAGGDEQSRQATLSGLRETADRIRDGTELFRRSPQGHGRQNRFDGYLREYLRSNRDSIVDAFHHMGGDFDAFEQTGASAFAQLFERVPYIDVQIKLSVERDQNLRREIASNDIPDTIHMGMAIPYCYAVGGDRYTVHIIRKTSLDAKYGTLVFRELDELTSLLNSG